MYSIVAAAASAFLGLCSQASLVLFACPMLYITYTRYVFAALALIHCIDPAWCWMVGAGSRERRGE